MPEDNIQGMGMWGVSIGVAVIVIVLMSLILQEIRDDAGIVPDQTASHANETLTWAGNNTQIQFLEGRINTGTFNLYNNGSLVNKGSNYTITESGVTILNQSGGGNDNWGLGTGTLVTGKLNASYDYYYGSAARNATNQGLAGQNTFASFLPLAALAAIGGLLIAIALRYFGGRKMD